MKEVGNHEIELDECFVTDYYENFIAFMDAYGHHHRIEIVYAAIGALVKFVGTGVGCELIRSALSECEEIALEEVQEVH